MSQRIVLLVIGIVALSLWVRPAMGKADGVDSAAALAQAVAQAQPGDEVLIAPGRYDGWEVELSGRGREDAPITIRPATPNSVVFVGDTRFRVIGEHLEISGLMFESVTAERSGGVFYFDGSKHCRLTDSQFVGARMEHLATLIWFQRAAADNRIDHCRFADNQYRCIKIDTYNDYSLEHGPPLRNRIDHNLFIDGPPRGVNGGETVQIGNGPYPHSLMEPQTLVEDNTFIRCNGEAEIISVKSSGNTIRRNLFIDCDGEVVMRNGNNGVIEDNVFLGGLGGVRLSGRGHRVSGNRIVSPRRYGIVLYYGVEDEQRAAAYPPVSGCVIEGNTVISAGEAAIFIGAIRNKTWHNERWTQPPFNDPADMAATVPPRDNQIRHNTLIGEAGKLLVHDHAPDNNTADNTLIVQP